MGDMTHIYTGPTINGGITANTKVKIVGKKSGGKLVRNKEGQVFLVGANQLQPV